MLNQCNFIGRTGKDTELRYTPGGDAVANVSIAVSEKYKDRDGNKQEKTEWINVVAWRKLAEIMGKYVTKGQLIFISGKIQTRSYDDRDGNKRYVTEIVASEMQMLSGSSDNSQRHQNPQQNQGGAQQQYYDDSDVPF